MIEVKLIKVTQPIGVFFVGKLKTKEIASISVVNRVNENYGIQRRLNEKKVKEITDYCNDPDATFPTSIIINIDTSNKDVELMDMKDGFYKLVIKGTKRVCEIIDGQHRIYGVTNSNVDMEMPIVVMFDLTEEEKAYVFSTINSNQTKVDKSTIYQLFDLSNNRSPLKTCHDIARIMNSSKESPFFNRLKMLGYKNNEMQSLSQGTFVGELVKLISKDLKHANDDMINIKKNIELKDDENIPLRKYFIEEKDHIIYKILFNYFSAIKDVFEKEWNNSDKYILTKTTGFGALLLVFKDLYYVGIRNNDLSYIFFKSKFTKVKDGFKESNIKLTSDMYGSGVQKQKQLYKDIIKFTND